MGVKLCSDSGFDFLSAVLKQHLLTNNCTSAFIFVHIDDIGFLAQNTCNLLILRKVESKMLEL